MRVCVRSPCNRLRLCPSVVLLGEACANKADRSGQIWKNPDDLGSAP